MTRELHEQICLSFPGVMQDIKWENDLCFLVGKKMFSVGTLHTPYKLSLKVDKDEFDKLTDRKGIQPAPYLARYNWILVTDLQAMDAKEWTFYLKRSYELVFQKLPKKLQKEINGS